MGKEGDGLSSVLSKCMGSSVNQQNPRGELFGNSLCTCSILLLLLLLFDCAGSLFQHTGFSLISASRGPSL